jgi:hypothetical protein
MLACVHETQVHASVPRHFPPELLIDARAIAPSSKNTKYPNDQKSCKKGTHTIVKKGGCAWPAAVTHTLSLSLSHSLALWVRLVDPGQVAIMFLSKVRETSLHFSPAFPPHIFFPRAHTLALTPMHLSARLFPCMSECSTHLCTAPVHPAGQLWPERADTSPVVKVAFGQAWTEDVACALHGLQVCKTITCVCTSKNALRGKSCPLSRLSHPMPPLIAHMTTTHRPHPRPPTLRHRCC